MAFRNLALATSLGALLVSISSGVSAQVVYTENFDAAASLAASGFTIEDLSGAGTWTLTTGTNKRVRVDYDELAPHNDWLITPAIAMTAGRTYVVSYEISGGGNATFDEADVFVGGPFGAAPTSADFLLGAPVKSYNFGAGTELTANTSPIREKLTFVPTATGNHHLAFQAKSIADQNFVQVDLVEVFDATTATPEKATVIVPGPSATNVNRDTLIYASEVPSADSVTIRLNTNAALLGDPASIVLNASTTQLFADPPSALAASTTYFARVDTINANGTTVGDTFSFTTRAVPAVAGDLYFQEAFTGPHSISQPLVPNPPVVRVNPKYASLPGGFQGLDLDAGINGSNFVASDGWYVTGGELVSRYNLSTAANDDWTFWPAVTTHPTIQTLAVFDARVRTGSIPETFEVYWQSVNPASIDPVDYGTPIATVTTSTTAFTPFAYPVPAGVTGRFAIRYVSAGASQIRSDNYRMVLAAGPTATQLEYPANGATNVNRNTFLQTQISPLADTYTIRLATNPADIGLPASIVLNNSAALRFADPPTLAGSTTYYARVDVTNVDGTTTGPVTTFTTRAAAVTSGDILGFWDFTETFVIPDVPPTSPGYPEVPKGFALLDVDGGTSALGHPVAWYRFDDRFRSGPACLATRYNDPVVQNDDWVFLPEIVVPPSLNAQVSFWHRTRTTGFTETVEVRVSTTGTNSTNPADYSTLLETFDIADDVYSEKLYTLAAGTTSRLAIRYVSNDQSQYLIDDVTISYIPGPIANGDANGDGVINVADATAVYNFAAGLGSAPTGDGDVVMPLGGMGQPDAADASAIVQFVVNGTPF